MSKIQPGTVLRPYKGFAVVTYPRGLVTPSRNATALIVLRCPEGPRPGMSVVYVTSIGTIYMTDGTLLRCTVVRPAPTGDLLAAFEACLMANELPAAAQLILMGCE